MTTLLRLDGEYLLWLQLDLANIGSVVHAVEELKGKERNVDILINNAGMATKELETTDAGWEMAMAPVGDFVFANGLFPLLKNAASRKNSDVRVVTLSSSAHYVFLPSDYQFCFTDPGFLSGRLPYEPWKWRFIMKRMFTINALYYSMAKVANVMFAQELQRRFDRLGLAITSLSVHPGSVASDNAVGIFAGAIQPIVRRTMLSLDEGSFTSLFAATADVVWRKPELYKGKYLEPFGTVKGAHVVVKDETQVRGLWDNTTEAANKHLSQRGHAPLHEW